MLDPALDVKWSAFFPLPTFPNFAGGMLPAKEKHNVRDILRMTKTYGMRVGRPSREDPDWAIPHAAFEFANGKGKGPDLARALFAARWTSSEDIAMTTLRCRSCS